MTYEEFLQLMAMQYEAVPEESKAIADQIIPRGRGQEFYEGMLFGLDLFTQKHEKVMDDEAGAAIMSFLIRASAWRVINPPGAN